MKYTEYIQPIVEIVELKIAESFAGDNPDENGIKTLCNPSNGECDDMNVWL
ncbi:MAG: hypothetical protein FWF72_07225 [Paludibacter sp.]|nr:hypothetical protein [Paludibacter sp.]